MDKVPLYFLGLILFLFLLLLLELMYILGK